MKKTTWAGCATVVAVLVATPAAAYEPTAPERTDWNEDSHCLRHGAKTKHGYPNAGTQSDPTFSGEHVGYARSFKHLNVPVVGFGPECSAHRTKDAGTIGVNVHVFKLNTITGEPALCYASGWVTNGIGDAWTMSVHVVPTAGAQGLCGEGHYKTQAWSRIWENGSWEPAQYVCTKTKTTGCLKPAIVPDWHFFPATMCHVDPSSTTCPASPW